jgi:hypothetical protein
MTIPRVFSPAEVDALIPELTERVREQLQRQSVIEEALAELARHAGGLPRTLDADANDDAETARLKDQLRQRIGEYESGWLMVQAMGAIVKDPQIGLLDFYGRVNGELVWLCWRYGEESLRYWHSLESGYAGRRPLRREAGDRVWN